MDHFDPLEMSYLHSPMPFNSGNMQNLDYMSVPSVMDGQDQYSNFDSEPYMSGDEMSFAPSAGLQHPALMKRYSSGFDDPFAESTLAQFDQIATEGLPDSPSIDRDSKYLSFSMPQYNFTLLDDSFRRSSVNINAQLHGMFFLAESQWPVTADAPPPPPELTCYRRNLFQITGSITLPRNLRYVFTDDGSRIPIYELELAVSATESVEGNTVKIISVPWKTPSGGETAKPEDKIEREPPTIPLDKMSGQDLDTDYTTFPIQWKRLQFRIATANNGRRKELQQHFTLHLKIMASLSTGGKFSIAEVHSGAVIVRGRSPRNFAARKDLPLSSSSTARKHMPSVNRNPTSQTSIPQVTSAPKLKSPPDEVPQMLMHYEGNELRSTEADTGVWPSNVTISDPLSTPNYSAMMNPTNLSQFTHEPSPELQTPQPFAFGYPADLQANNSSMSLHFSSDDEGGSSPYPHRQTSRPSSRPPTSNPSPSLINKPRAATYANNISSPGPAPDVPQARPRHLSHQLSSMSLPTNLTSAGGPVRSMSAIPQRPELLHMKSNYSYSPEPEFTDPLYEYIPLPLEDWIPPVDAVFRPHVVHHETALPQNGRSPLTGRNKRYFSEVA